MPDRDRSRIGWWSLGIAAVAISLLPLAAWPNIPIAPSQHVLMGPPRVKEISPWKERPILIARDPFVPDPTRLAHVLAGRHAKKGLAAAVRLKAIALGRLPQALIEVNGATRIVSPGDAIGPFRVRAVTAKGVELTNGSIVILSL